MSESPALMVLMVLMVRRPKKGLWRLRGRGRCPPCNTLCGLVCTQALCYTAAMLYVVATPIGNLEDVSLRALRILKEVALIAAEDTRKTRRLLARYDIHTRLTSYYEHSQASKLETILANLEHGDVALVSEAGMPGISDPGYELVRAAVERGIQVVPIPGPSAPVTALAVSGLPSDRFLYLGFLPRRPAERRRLLAGLAGFPHTMVAFEAPHRLVKTLADLAASLGPERRLAVCGELTKLFEEVRRGTAPELVAHYGESAPRGEFTLVIEGAGSGSGEDVKWLTRPATASSSSAPSPAARLRELLAGGATRSDAVKQVAVETGLPRREVYALSLGRSGPAGARGEGTST